MITEKEIQLLGFEKNFMNNYEGDTEYYYSYDIVNGLSLMSNTNIEAENEGFKVELFNVDPSIVFSNFGEIQAFINNMERKIVKK